MNDLIIAFDSIGEAALYVVDEKTYDLLFEIYKNQTAGSNGYSDMMEKFWKVLVDRETERGGSFDHILLQWNSHDHLKETITFKRILQVLCE